MNKSRLTQEDKIYVKFDDSGNTQIVNTEHIQPGYSYRRVKNAVSHQQTKSFLKSNQAFIDKTFIIDQAQISTLGNGSQRIVLKRLYDLYTKCPKSIIPEFFPSKNYIPPKKLSSDPHLPPFATQIGVFPSEYYKSFFITQNFAENGKYEMVINNRGRFETDIVDDWVPVYQYSLQPIWGFDLDQAWKIILLKFWAKRNQGYHNIPKIPPFFFLENFTNANWKYFNLSRDGLQFLSFYTGKTDYGKFILKTKNAKLVQAAGLVPNSAGYELINLIQKTNNQQKQQRKFVATIRSTMANKWSGALSILDKQMNDLYYPQKHKLSLQRDFMIAQTDLLNLFSTAYIASRRQEQQRHYISDYYLLNIEPNNKSSVYLKFEIQKDGWFDFCIKQADDNKITPNDKSKLDSEQYGHSFGYNDGKRFLKSKFILVKQNTQKSPSTLSQPAYLDTNYDAYEIQNYHGYNRGDAKFLNVVKGTYILKIKTETINKDVTFVINYASNMMINISQIYPNKSATSRILRQALSSLIGPLSLQNKEENKDFVQIVYSNSFQDIGYGFVGSRLKKDSKFNLLIDVDPALVEQSGYKFKNQFKAIKTPFSVLIKPGQSTTIVLKKKQGLMPEAYVWPPRGFQTFQQQI